MSSATSNQGQTNGSTSNLNSPKDTVTNRPSQQAKFISFVEKGQADGEAADNDMQRGGALAVRSKALCGLMVSKSVSDWKGWISKVDSNTDGKGVLGVKIAEDVHVTTWNNSFSDISDQTLLEPGSRLFNTAASLKKGQEVKFSGSFVADDTHCLSEQSITLRGKLSDPEFTFRFSQISPL